MAQLRRRKTTDTTDAVEQIVKHTKKKEPKDESIWIDPLRLIPSGSTPLNCALSDDYQGGYLMGTIVNTIGDSGTGKTLLALNNVAEMTLYKRFNDYRFIFDDTEAALANNISYMFGDNAANRLEGPNGKLLKESDEPSSSNTIQDLYVNLLTAIKKGQPFIYILDSLDALTSREEQLRAAKMLTSKKKEEKEEEEVEEGGKKPKKKEPGSFKMEKAKMVSEILRVITREIKNRKAFVNIISQTRDNIGWGFSDTTRSGGRALKFYCCHEMWISATKPIEKLKEKIGSNSKIIISKNKLTFKKRTIEVPIYDNFGIDDVGSCIDYLVAQNLWKKDKNTIKAEHFDWEGTRDNIIKRVERSEQENELQKLVGSTWTNKEERLKLDRKRRYE